MSLVQNLKLKIDDFILEVPIWKIADKGITVLSGPSGSGKSTLVRCLLGLQECPGLSWQLGGVELAKLPVRERKLGVVFQTLELFPHMSAEENILFSAKARGIVGDVAKQTAAKLAEKLSITACMRKKVSVLSGGEKQRVALARAIIGEPRFLFLDEPFSSLDVQLRKEARSLVKEVIAEFSIPCLVITHDPEDVEVLADHVVKIENGKLLLK